MQHRLVCSACGAPLSKMTHMPVKKETTPKSSSHPVPKGGYSKKKSKKFKKPKKRMKSFLGEAFDLIEDIFD